VPGLHQRRLWSIAILALFGALRPAPATAACFYPDKDLSGYHIPLEAETRTSRAIVIGQVTSQQDLHEDASDPDGISAYVYTVRVLRQLKGTVPGSIKLRTENDSGRYPMSVGERHLLFFDTTSDYFQADPCGNSTELPRGNAIVKKLEQLLAGKPKSR
jgi:hypothetical protein